MAPRSACCVVVLLVLATVGLAQRLAAQTIDTIVVDNRNIFEPPGEAPGFLARAADALHIRTRAWVIRRALLFDPGDAFDSSRAVESARALRALGVFREVALDTTRVGERLALRATTTDGWSTRPQAQYASTGGSVTWSAGLEERNALGTATGLLALYEKTPDRDQWLLGLQAHGVLARRALLGASWLDRSDGRVGAWSYGVPFTQTSSRASLVTYGQAGWARVLRFTDGVLTDSVQRRGYRFGLSGGLALRATGHDYARLRWLAQLRREQFTAGGGLLPDSATFATALGLELSSSRFAVAEGLDKYARGEDVDVSRRLWIGLWAAPRVFGYAPGRAGIGPEMQAQWGTAWGRSYAWLSASADGLIGSAGLDSGRVELGATLMSQRFPRQTLVLHGEGGMASAVAPGTEFDTWAAQNGPRAFAAHAFTGTRRYWGVVEDRILVAGNALGLLGVGLAPFVEWGGAWYADERPRAGGDVGLALRLGETRSTEGLVTEIAVAWRFGDGFTGNRWTVVVRPALQFRR